MRIMDGSSDVGCSDLLDEAALGVRVVAVARQGGVAVGVAEEGLLAGGGEFDRAAGAQGEQDQRDLEAWVLAVAGAAGAAGDADLHETRTASGGDRGWRNVNAPAPPPSEQKQQH